MNETPRTDSMMEAARPVSWQASYGRAVELCRELERESAARELLLEKIAAYFRARNLGEPARVLQGEIAACLRPQQNNQGEPRNAAAPANG